MSDTTPLETGTAWQFPPPAVYPHLPEPPPSTCTARVLHLVNGEHYSGAERVQDLLAGRLPEFGYDVGFVCVRPGRFAHERVSQDAPLSYFPMSHRLDLRPVWHIKRLVRAENYDLLHAHTPRTAMLGCLAAAMARVPLVYHVHSPTSRDSARAWHNWANTVVETWSLRRATRLICVSQSLARHTHQSGFPADRIRVVPNGVPPAARPSSRRPPRGTWTLGSVALFRPRKGIEVLIETVARLRRQRLPVRLRLVGPFETPEYEAHVKSLCHDCGVAHVVDWIGFTPDVPAALDRIDLFVLPSLYGEGLPMVVLEAMAAGVPVVGTNVEGVPEAIRHGIDGLIAEPNDPDDLAGQIAEIIRGRHDWSALREHAMVRHAKHFSDTAMARGVAEVYRQMLEAGG